MNRHRTTAHGYRKKRAFLIIVAIALLCVAAFVCLSVHLKTRTEANSAEALTRLLTIDDVRRLAEKGAALTWSDFDAYTFTETGFGLYIRVYEIDERFSLMIGGGPTDEPPMYVYLVSKSDSEERIEIRSENPETFIASHGGVTSTVSDEYDIETGKLESE